MGLGTYPHREGTESWLMRRLASFRASKSKKEVSAGIRTRNLLLRRQAPYPLGHRDRTADRGPKKVPLRPREGSICCLDRSVIDEACEIAIRTLKLFYPIFTSSPIFGSVAARRRDGAGVVAFGRAHMVSL